MSDHPTPTQGKLNTGPTYEDLRAEIERLVAANKLAVEQNFKDHAEIERLRDMCVNREEFIAERGLWREFSAWLAVPRALEGK